MKPRLLEKYENDIRPQLMGADRFKNVHQVPAIQKIVINMGVSGTLEKGALEYAASDLMLITGQKPVYCLAKKSVSNFKLREGQPIGCKVTLRRQIMWEFFDRLVRLHCLVFETFEVFPNAPLMDEAIILWGLMIKASSPK